MSQIEKVEDFKYLGSYTNSQYDVQCRKTQARAAVHALDRVWRMPISRLAILKIFRTMVEPILIYRCDSWSLTQAVENALDNTYTRMLHCRKIKTCHGAILWPTKNCTAPSHCETKASSSGRSCDASWWSTQQSPALKAQWPSEKTSTNNNSAKPPRERHEPLRDKFTINNEEPKPLEGNHHVTTLSA